MYSDISKRIKKQREFLNYSQEYVAECLGITQPAYVKIEKGTTKLDFKRLLKLSEILEIDINELLDKNLIINNFNNKDSSTAIGLVENLQQENKKSQDVLIESLKEQINDLKKENERFLTIIETFLKDK